MTLFLRRLGITLLVVLGIAGFIAMAWYPWLINIYVGGYIVALLWNVIALMYRGVLWLARWVRNTVSAFVYWLFIEPFTKQKGDSR